MNWFITEAETAAASGTHNRLGGVFMSKLSCNKQLNA
jgi:hypothetical protein